MKSFVRITFIICISLLNALNADDSTFSIEKSAGRLFVYYGANTIWTSELKSDANGIDVSKKNVDRFTFVVVKGFFEDSVDLHFLLIEEEQVISAINAVYEISDGSEMLFMVDVKDGFAFDHLIIDGKVELDLAVIIKDGQLALSRMHLK